jgi:hypothetical protein
MPDILPPAARTRCPYPRASSEWSRSVVEIVTVSLVALVPHRLSQVGGPGPRR